jgi:hypothetical protein
MLKYRYHLLIFLVVLIASTTFSWSKIIGQTEVLTITAEELDWHKANMACSEAAGGWSLPSITQLVGLFYFNHDTHWHKSTDYWSDTLLTGRGFGLNTKLGILSYDVLTDQDHFICVRHKDSLASS